METTVLLTVLIWTLSIAGAIWGCIICLAAGMRTNPYLSGKDALTTVPLPSVSFLLSGWHLWQMLQGGEGLRALLLAVIPLLLALLTLLFVSATYITQPAHRR